MRRILTPPPPLGRRGRGPLVLIISPSPPLPGGPHPTLFLFFSPSGFDKHSQSHLRPSEAALREIARDSPGRVKAREMERGEWGWERAK